MGTVLIGLPMTAPSGETIPMAVMIEKAYLPKKGQSSLCILSTGRLFEKQGIKITLNDVNRLEIGEYSYKFGTRNYSPFITATIPDSQGGDSRPRVSVHVTGVPRHTTLRAGHMRLGHASMQTVAEVFGLKTTRSCLCDICLVFKARAPSASTTPAIKRATKAGQCVHLAHWSYRVEAAIKGFTGILGAVDEALDLFDVIGTKEPNGKMTSDFLKYLWILYGSEYRTELESSA